MNHSLDAVEIFASTWNTSRDYFVQLTDLDKEQARMEGQLEGGTVAEHHKRRKALMIYREIIAATWGHE